jgi:fumarylpyruvate hydrolase
MPFSPVTLIPEIIISHPSLPILSRKLSVWTALGHFSVNIIYCIGQNYRERAIEMGYDPNRESPFLSNGRLLQFCQHFWRQWQCSFIWYQPMTSSSHFEGELVVCIGEEFGRDKTTNLGRNVESHIFRYAIGHNLTRPSWKRSNHD